MHTTTTVPVLDCWLGRRVLCCLGPLGADREWIVPVWLWCTGTDGLAELTADEQAALSVATAVVPVGSAPQAVRRRLAERIGRRRALAEGDRWGLWTVPVDAVEAVLDAALTRHMRSGRARPPVVA